MRHIEEPCALTNVGVLFDDPFVLDRHRVPSEGDEACAQFRVKIMKWGFDECVVHAEEATTPPL